MAVELPSFGRYVLCFTLVGCAGLTGSPSLTLVSRSSLDRFYRAVGEPIEVESCRYNVLLLGFAGNAAPSHTEVIDQALERSGADILLNATVESVHWPFVLFNRYCTRVRGQPALRREVPLPPPPVPPREPLPPESPLPAQPPLDTPRVPLPKEDDYPEIDELPELPELPTSTISEVSS